MAARRDDVVVSSADGFAFPELADDSTTQIGIFLELRGTAATAATASCVLKKGSNSVTLTPSVATAGEVTASVTAANLTTLTAVKGDIVTAFWEGTITDSGVTHTFRHEMAIMVEDRLYRWGVLMANLAIYFPEVAKSCTYPANQSNWWPQARLALRNLRNRIDRQQGGMRAYAISHPEDLTELAEYAVLLEIGRVMYRSANGKDKDIANFLTYWSDEFKRLWSETIARVKSPSQEWQTDGGDIDLHIDPVKWMGGMGATGGGGVL